MTTNYIYWLPLGLLLAVALLVYARSQSHNAEKNILGIALIIAAIIYVPFALIWGTPEWMIIELIGVPIYGLFYWLAQRYSFYWLAAGWAAHPLWDAILHLQGTGASIAPEWYAVTCISFDLFVAAYIVWITRE